MYNTHTHLVHKTIQFFTLQKQNNMGNKLLKSDWEYTEEKK